MGRIYATGKTKSWIASGRAILYCCGGRWNGNRWEGSNFTRLYRYPTERQGHMVAAGPGGWGGIALRTRVATDGSAWITEIAPADLLFDAQCPSPRAYKVWHDDEAPETLSVFWKTALSVEEWAYESFAGGTLRPCWAGDIRRTLRNKPAGSVSTTCAYVDGVIASEASVVGTNGLYPGTLPDLRGGTSEIAETFSGYALYCGGTSYEIDSDGLPYPNALFGAVSELYFDGEHAWVSSGETDLIPSSENARFATGFSFFAAGPFLDGGGYRSVPRWDIPVEGEIRDWNGRIYNVPVSFDEAETHAFTGSAVVNATVSPIIDSGWLTARGYDNRDAKAAILREGSEWDALRIDRAPMLTAVSFAAVDWDSSDCEASISDGGLHVSATGSNPILSRDLINDLNDIEPDPSAWRTAHDGSLEDWVKAWWNGEPGGPTLTLSGPGEWFRIGRRLRPDGDVFNWSSWRYADFIGKADADCNINLTFDWDEITITESPANEPLISRQARRATYPIALTTEMTPHEIDLPAQKAEDGELVGHAGLRCIRSLSMSGFAGRTIDLSEIVLKEKSRPVLDVHAVGIGDSEDDPAMIGALADGKQALLLTPRMSGYPNSLWGWPVKARHSGDGERASGMLISQLAAEINLQEGWSASVIGEPENGDPNYAVWLEEIFEARCPATLKARRSYGSFAAYPRSGISLSLDANLGNAIHGILCDEETRSPLRTTVRAEIPPEEAFTDMEHYLAASVTILDGATTEADGSFRLEMDGVEGVELRSAPGTANQRIFPEPFVQIIGFNSLVIPRPMALASRTWWCAAFGGEGEASFGGDSAVLDIDRTGASWAVFEPSEGEWAGFVTLARRFGSATDWELFGIAKGGSAWLHVDETQREPRIRVVFERESGSIYQLSSKRGGMEGWSQLKTIAETGSNPFLRKDKVTGLTFYLYWRDVSGGTLFMKRSDDDGASFMEEEITVRAGVPRQTATFDFSLDAERTMILVFTDGSSLLSIVSADNGLTWS